MPDSRDAGGEIYRRLNAVEQAISNHMAECSVRNEDLREWRKAAHADIDSLKIDRAKAFGIAIAASTLASALGTSGVIALFKAFGQ